MNFDFRSIVGPENSIQGNFSSLCSRLVMKLFPDALPIDGKGGDEGIDTLVGTFNGVCHAYQHKYFVDKIGPSQRTQIKKSLKSALSYHRLKKWILMLPKDPSPYDIRWFESLSREHPDIECEWWGKTKLLMLLSENPVIARDFQPPPSLVTIILDARVDIKTSASQVVAQTIGDRLNIDTRNTALCSLVQDLQNRSRLRVLVWGPGPEGNEIYKKRCQLRNELKRFGHAADFPEELASTDTLLRSGLNLTVVELVQAISYDYIVCFMASPGSIGEVHDFAKRRDLAGKMIICIDKCHHGGYSGQGTLRIFEGGNGRIDWFESPTDITDCHLSTRLLEQIQKVSERKQWEIATG